MSHDLVLTMVRKLDGNLREAYEERAGVMEFEALLPRGQAESLALLDVLNRHPFALTGVTVLEIELDGAKQWLLTTDLSYARQYLVDVHAKELGTPDLRSVLNHQYEGIAGLSTLG